MMDKFAGILEGWLAFPLRSGLFFWLGGLVGWLAHVIDWQAIEQLFSGASPKPASLVSAEWQPFWHWLTTLKPEYATLLFFSFLFLASLAAMLVKSMTTPTLKFLEGYGWPQWTIRKAFKQKSEERMKCLLEKALDETGINFAKLNAVERHEYHKLDQKCMHLPETDALMPTRLGNLLRSFEQKPQERYGLDAIICWPRLWILLPAELQTELTEARNALNDAVQIWIWGLLFLVWTSWSWWALLVSGFVMWAAYHWMRQAALIYGQLVQASFDMYRHSLYKALRWPLPQNPAQEAEEGKKLTAYLWRGAMGDYPAFTSTDEGKDK